MKYLSSLTFCLLTLLSWPTVTFSNGSFMPEAVCQTATVMLDVNGSVEVQPTDIDGGSTVPTGHFLTVSPAIFDCSAVGTPQNIRLFVRDQLSVEQSSCTTTITVTDNLPPTAICQVATIFLDANGVASTTAVAIDDGSFDNCGIANLALDQSTFDCTEIGLNPVVLTVTDINSNTSTCNTTVTVEDNILPVVVCPNTYTAGLNASGQVFVGAFFLVSAATDNCSASFPLEFTIFDCSDLGSQQSVTFTSTDPSGNVGSCTTLATIVDNIAPNALCQNITVQLDANGQVNVAANLVDNGSTDNCAVTNYSLDESVFDCSEVGANTVILTVSDASNNTNSCTAIITVEDNVFPNALCTNATVPLDANGQATINASLIDGGSADNCALVSALTSVDINSFDCSDLGPNAVVLSVTDVNSNVSTCNATVTIVDNTPPVITCQSSTTVQLNAAGSGATGPFFLITSLTDNCSVPYPNNNVFLDCNDVGQQNFIINATDPSGNTASCTVVVTVVDNIAPTVSCKTITVSPPQSGSISISPEDVEDVLSSDACGLASKTVSPNSFTCNDAGANPVTFTVTDVNGNVSSCNATVNVSCLLPVEWGSFDGFLQENDVVLEWTTLQEENNAYFQIEHSKSGVDFAEIGRMTGRGDSFDTQTYQFIHSQASLGANYYRIRQVDHDGVSSVSSIIQVEINSKTTETALRVFPNPSQDRLYYQLPEMNSDDLSVSVYNKLGQLIHTATFSGMLEVSDWEPGHYWLIVRNGTDRWLKAFVVQ